MSDYILDDPDAWETVPCDRCGTPHESLVKLEFAGSPENIHLYGYGKWQYVECPNCRLRFYSPRLKQNSRCIGETLTNEASRVQAETLFNHGSFWPVENPSVQIALVKNFYGAFLRKCSEQYLGRKPRSIYEIGSSVGWLLSTARGLFPKCRLAGCEPNIHAVEYCKRVAPSASVEAALFCNATIAVESFDMVVGWNYIEHTYTPMADIRKAWSILRPGGVMMLRTFHEDGNGDGYESSPIAHQYHFFQDVLVEMVSACGFDAAKEVTDRDFFVYGRKP